MNNDLSVKLEIAKSLILVINQILFENSVWKFKRLKIESLIGMAVRNNKENINISC